MNDTCFPEGPENDPRFDIIKDFVRKHNFKFSAIGMKLRNKDYKNIKDIFDEITKELDEDMSISEKCWNIFNPNQRPEYKDDKKPKFRNFKDGYVGYHTNNIPSSKRKGGYTPIDYSSLSEDQISELKNEFLNKTKEILDNDPDKRHFSSSIKKNKNLLDDIMYHTKFLDEDCSFSERVYSYMNDYSNENIICKYGNKFTFIGYNFGYRGGCGRASSCKCVSEKVSKSISNTKSTFTKERNQEINEKRNQTVLEKSGGEYCNNGQSPTAKKKHREFYDDKEKVRAQVEKQENTCMEKYGVTNAAKLPEIREKITETSLEKYGVKNYNQKHLPKESLKIIEDPHTLDEIYQKEGSIRTAEILGVTPGLINRSVLKYGLEKNIVNSGEKEIYEFIKELGVENISQNSRPLDGKEIDILCKDINIGFEFNGIYWHSTKFKDAEYHMNKNILAENMGYEISHIFEDEWRDSKDKIKNLIERKIGLSNKETPKGKTFVDYVSKRTSDNFMNEYHIDGYKDADYHCAVYKKDDIVAIMTFSKNTKNKSDLIQFSFSHTIKDDIKMLLDYFISENNISEIEFVMDMKFNFLKEFLDYGFKVIDIIPPKAFYYCEEEKIPEDLFDKEKLLEIYGMEDNGYDLDELIDMLNIHKVYDCGYKKLSWKKKK